MSSPNLNWSSWRRTLNNPATSAVTMPAVSVREANKRDFSRIVELYRQLQPNDPRLDDGRDRAAFETILERDGLTLFVLEDEDSTVQATCYLNVIPNLTRSARPYAIIENVVTEERLRGSGYGKQVVGHALDAAWQAGCYKVMLQTGSSQASTHAFYRACGFSGTDKHGYVAWRPGWQRP